VRAIGTFAPYVSLCVTVPGKRCVCCLSLLALNGHDSLAMCDSLCLSTSSPTKHNGHTASEAGQSCTTPAELCGGTDRACKLQVVTSPFKQYGDASGAKRTCIVEAKVAIGNYFRGWAAMLVRGMVISYLCRPVIKMNRTLWSPHKCRPRTGPARSVATAGTVATAASGAKS
jgi:hypothetical protein